MDHVIDVENLSKTFLVRQREAGLVGMVRQLIAPRSESVVAVEQLSFRIQPGERVAFIGPNGAGKSTTIKMLSGVLHPTSGRARIAGFDPWRERKELSYRVGTVFGQRSQLWYHLPAADSFELLMHVYDQSGSAYRLRRAKLIDAFDIGPHLQKPVRQLSLGERMRCELVASLLHAPDLLFLDEPTIGLDVAAKATIREVLCAESREHGRTLLLTSHDTADMERVCDRVIVIARGRRLLDRPLSALRQSYIAQKRVVLQLASAHVTLALPGVREIARAAHRLELEVDTTHTSIESLIARVIEQGQLRDVTIEDPPLDEIVQAIYRDAAVPRQNALREAS